MNNNNSFAENMAQLTEKTTNALNILESINESMYGNDAEINIDGEHTLPAYSNVIKRLQRAEDTISKFTQGNGVIETDDGTYRKISVSTVSRPPMRISDVPTIGEFSTNPNWFFENLQYPKCVVNIDLKDKIDDTSDRVYINRVILSTKDAMLSKDDVLSFYRINIAGKNIKYPNLIELLENNNIRYSEDKDVVSLPLSYEKYDGEFTVTDIKFLKNSKGVSQMWYYLDSMNYTTVDENGNKTSNGHALAVDDHIRYNNSLFRIADMSMSQKRICLDYAIGYETIGVGDKVYLYNAPFSNKIVQVGIGVDEINIIYIKGVNENYNLLSREWSDPISFYTNDLKMESNNSIDFLSYYTSSVADFGSDWIAQAKEKRVYAYNGKQPNTPIINVSDLKVVQINTQLDATLDKESYNNLTTQIASTKSNITATRNTIATNKDLLIQSTTKDKRNSIQNLINTDTETLNSLTTQYNSLVEELNTLLNESGVINYSPKYHVRGFFAIPEPRYSDEINKLGEQSVIGFEIQYRYLHTDETGVKLNTYEYTDTSTSTTQTGIFTDWNCISSATLTKVYNEDTQSYEWTKQSTADGTQININQIDIPIKNGEKVEIKVRSISEAGYPYNPLKSEWSESVIVSFPENLTNDDSVTTMLDTIKSDMTAVVLQETMSAAGVYSHLADTNSLYKHAAENISYKDTSVTDEQGNETITEMPVQTKLDKLTTAVNNLTALGESIKDMTMDIKNLTTAVESIQKFLGYSDGKAPNLDEYSHSNNIMDVIADIHDFFKIIKDIIDATETETPGN